MLILLIILLVLVFLSAAALVGQERKPCASCRFRYRNHVQEPCTLCDSGTEWEEMPVTKMDGQKWD